MSRAKTFRLTAWEAVKAVERSYKIKDRFFELSAEAYKRNPRGTQKIREKLARGEITLNEALRRLERLAKG